QRRPLGGYRGLATAFALLLFALFAAGVSTPAKAAMACTISMTPINFGIVDVSLGSAVLTTGTITANCTGAKKNATARTCLSIDRGSAGDATSRKLLSGAISLRMDFYSDAAM